jgi:hypothetical protein
MRKGMNILKDYKSKDIEAKISPEKKRIIDQAVRKVVNDYGEVYKRLATE